MTKLTNLADLNAAKACEVTYDLELLHPTSKAPLGLFIQVIGMQSEAMRSLRNQQTNELIRQNFEAQRKSKAEVPTVEQVQKRSVQTLTEATVGWYAKDGDKTIKGLPMGDAVLEYSKSAAAELYANPAYEWLREQVDEAVGDLGNFLKG